jgi:hypothetical protein
MFGSVNCHGSEVVMSWVQDLYEFINYLSVFYDLKLYPSSVENKNRYSEFSRRLVHPETKLSRITILYPTLSDFIIVSRVICEWSVKACGHSSKTRLRFLSWHDVPWCSNLCTTKRDCLCR